VQGLAPMEAVEIGTLKYRFLGPFADQQA
jgi:hypothetical protein